MSYTEETGLFLEFEIILEVYELQNMCQTEAKVFIMIL
jgi:hypothetical protein